MAATSTERVRRFRAHRADRHDLCDAISCPKAATLENDAYACTSARCLLDHLKDQNIPWSDLGDEEAKLRKEARFPLESYPELAERYQPDFVIRAEARALADFLLHNAKK